MKSIRLDFPAAEAASDKEVLALMQDAFLYCATAKISTSKQQIARALRARRQRRSRRPV